MQELNECQRLEEPFRHEADAKEERAIVTEYGNSVFERVTEQIRRQPSLELGNFLRVRSGERFVLHRRGDRRWKRPERLWARAARAEQLRAQTRRPTR